jgi:hypothetical protein
MTEVADPTPAEPAATAQEVQGADPTQLALGVAAMRRFWRWLTVVWVALDVVPRLAWPLLQQCSWHLLAAVRGYTP